jgi:hypothetical protein
MLSHVDVLGVAPVGVRGIYRRSGLMGFESVGVRRLTTPATKDMADWPMRTTRYAIPTLQKACFSSSSIFGLSYFGLSADGCVVVYLPRRFWLASRAKDYPERKCTEHRLEEG